MALDRESWNAPLTPPQAAHFKKLRVFVFGVFLVVYSFALWQATMPGGQISKFVQSTTTTMSSTGRASVLAICVLLGLIFGWFASTNVARILARQVRT